MSKIKEIKKKLKAIKVKNLSPKDFFEFMEEYKPEEVARAISEIIDENAEEEKSDKNAFDRFIEESQEEGTDLPKLATESFKLFFKKIAPKRIFEMHGDIETVIPALEEFTFVVKLSNEESNTYLLVEIDPDTKSISVTNL